MLYISRLKEIIFLQHPTNVQQRGKYLATGKFLSGTSLTRDVPAHTVFDDNSLVAVTLAIKNIYAYIFLLFTRFGFEQWPCWNNLLKTQLCVWGGYIFFEII